MGGARCARPQTSTNLEVSTWMAPYAYRVAFAIEEATSLLISPA